MHIDKRHFHGNLKGFFVTIKHNFHSLQLKSVTPNFVACLVFLGIAFFCHYVNFFFRDIDKASGGHFEN